MTLLMVILKRVSDTVRLSRPSPPGRYREGNGDFQRDAILVTTTSDDLLEMNFR